jgi:hypothetical protein
LQCISPIFAGLENGWLDWRSFGLVTIDCDSFWVVVVELGECGVAIFCPCDGIFQKQFFFVFGFGFPGCKPSSEMGKS